MIRFACPHCQASLRAEESSAGQSTVCSNCGAALTIPEPVPPPRLVIPTGVEPAAGEPPMAEYVSEWATQEAWQGDTAEVPRPQPEDLLSPNGDVPAHEQAVDVQFYGAPEYSEVSSPPPPKRPFGLLATLLGLPGAAAFFVGVFLPLFEVNGKSLLANDWRLWLVQSGGILLGLVSLGLVLTRRYAGLWILGPGSLMSLLAAYGLLFARATEEHGIEKAMLLRPGQGLLILLGGGFLLTLSVLLSPRRKRYEYPGY